MLLNDFKTDHVFSSIAFQRNFLLNKDTLGGFVVVVT